ncbi:MAG TPA: hypothetical protein VL043_11855 [Protaetiibacter sp.]|nr:hypothetical protein [Protaetiibacter sp.]
MPVALIDIGSVKPGDVVTLERPAGQTLLNFTVKTLNGQLAIERTGRGVVTLREHLASGWRLTGHRTGEMRR